MRKDDLTIEQRAARVTIVVLTAALLVWLSYQLRIVIIDVLLAIIIASAISPVANAAQKRRVPRPLTVIVVYIGVALFYTGVGFLLAKPLKEQTELFKEHLPQYRQQVGSFYERWKDEVDDYANRYAGIDLFDDVHADGGAEAVIAPLLAPEAPVKVVIENPVPAGAQPVPEKPRETPSDKKKPRKVEPGQLQDVLTRVARETLTVTAGLLGALLNAVLVLFLAAYFVVEAPKIWKALMLWVPPPNRERAQSLIEPLGYRMGGYVRGQMLVSTAVAFIFAVGFSVINLQYSFVLAILAGLFNLIPFVGSMLITVLAILIAANTGGPVLIALTIGVFVVEQFLESNFIVPHLLGKQVDMHPLLVLLAILVGGTLAGALGAIVAVPLTSAMLFLAQEFYVKPINEGAA